MCGVDTDLCFCNLQIFSGGVCHLEQLHAQSPFLFPIVFSINLIPFFSILVQPECSLCPFLILCSGMRSFTWASAQLSLFVALAAGIWWFTAGCHVKALPLPPTPSQTEVCSTMGESIRPPSFHNPTLSAKKHVVQICRISLSARCRRWPYRRFS